MRTFQLDDLLNHILEAVNRIESYTTNLTYAEFSESTRDQDAVIRNFEVIGEASNLDKNFPDFVAAHPELPIRSAYDMRNALSRGTSGLISKSCGGPFTTISHC
ncbi:MAG TPA: HepT-like ribonuclease domain-containing protein [Granulicella sp.]|nr:HepT-like ribonuclease domain-containing protein [Granulicella sp.]